MTDWMQLEAERPYHPTSDLFPLMDGQEFDDLKADIAANGLLEPIWLHPDGSIIDGRNRYRACIETGTTPRFRTWEGDSPDSFVVSMNLHRRHLTKDQRNDLMRKLRSDGMTIQAVADAVGVSYQTAHAATRDVNIDFNIENTRGQMRPTSYASRHQPDIQILSADTHRIQIRSNNEWYTPSAYLNAARSVMGGIDVDPASSPTANENVQAARFYTKDDDGLIHDWPGRVWLNPPYGTSGPEFVAELLRQFTERIVTEAILLVNANATETQWFAPLWDHTLCFVRGRINFISTIGDFNGSTHGSVFVYLGQHSARFAQEFKQFGPVVQRIA